MKDKYKLPFDLGNQSPQNDITAAGMQKAFADSKRLDKEITLRNMLLHFKQKHNETNEALASSGESKRCTSFKTIDVADIKEYIEAMLFDEGG